MEIIDKSRVLCYGFIWEIINKNECLFYFSQMFESFFFLNCYWNNSHHGRTLAPDISQWLLLKWRLKINDVFRKHKAHSFFYVMINNFFFVFLILTSYVYSKMDPSQQQVVFVFRKKIYLFRKLSFYFSI